VSDNPRVVLCQYGRDPHVLDDECVEVTDVPDQVPVRVLAEVRAERRPLGDLP
jgi:hypothetical protein